MPRRAFPTGVLILATLLLVGGTDPVAAGGGCHGPEAAARTEGPATVVRMDVCSFQPTIVRVPVGTTVRFLNTAPNDHAVVGGGHAWGSDTLAPGAEFAAWFVEAGIHPYACPLHPGMVGAVVVGEPVAAAGLHAAGTAPPSADDPASIASGASGGETPWMAAGVVTGLVSGAILGLLGATSVARRRGGPSPTS